MLQFQQADYRSPQITQQQENQATPVKDNLNYRRHRGACRFYRENWSCESEPNSPGGQLLYQIICLLDTPPITDEEQQRCLHSPNHCWRLEAAARRNGKSGHAYTEADDDGNLEAEEVGQTT